MKKLLSFYRYTEVSDPAGFADEHLQWCLLNGIKGKVYVAEEGINGSVTGSGEQMAVYKNHLNSFVGFEDIWFKETETETEAFIKMNVRVKKELVNSGFRSDLQQAGFKLSPEELLKFYEEGKDFIIVDVRNWYESRIGKFKNAFTPGMRNFREWPEVVESLGHLKDKTIVTYCTGGIRCEKASAYMTAQGFKNVCQLEGGILNYIQKYPDTFWEGAVFVFDNRKVIEPNSKPELKYIAQCYFCSSPTSHYINCHNLECDRLFVCCRKCSEEKEYCCSEKCRNRGRKRKKIYI